MQQINVNELKVHPRNSEFFDDMTGDAWKAFLESIKTSGVIEPVVITPEKVIISGHQRVRACKELGIVTVLTDMRDYSDEDKILKDLIETNIRQRGIGNPNPVKLGRCIKELERIYGIQNGGDRKSDRNNFNLKYPDAPKTEREFADRLGITQQTLQNYKKLTEMIPELEELVDTGFVTNTTALAIMRNLSEEEQIKLISSMDTTKKITQKQVQQYLDKIKQLESCEPQVIDKTDYSFISRLENKIKELESEKSILERKVKLNQEDADRFNKLKSDIEFLTQKKNDLGRQIDSATELSGLTVKLQRLLEGELAPIKFKRCMEILESSDVCVENLLEIINKIDDWSYEMKKLLSDKCDYVVEVQ
ncbi:ParB/RepB/Spo0J family partition protein [[Clostridium] scindens]|nr:ParB/RepB/Spo0J family partition protein [[Clostridium] scindens]